jgi:hypothetical protein
MNFVKPVARIRAHLHSTRECFIPAREQAGAVLQGANVGVAVPDSNRILLYLAAVPLIKIIDIK